MVLYRVPSLVFLWLILPYFSFLVFALRYLELFGLPQKQAVSSLICSVFLGKFLALEVLLFILSLASLIFLDAFCFTTGSFYP